MPHADADYRRLERTYEHVLGSGSLLDAGCSDGRWLGMLSERSALKLHGTDASRTATGAARAFRRIEKLLDGSPEWLLVQIDK